MTHIKSLFGDTLERMRKLMEEAKRDTVFNLRGKYGVTQEELDEGKWIISEEGRFGDKKISLYKLVDTVSITIETKIRPSIKEKEELC